MSIKFEQKLFWKDKFFSKKFQPTATKIPSAPMPSPTRLSNIIPKYRFRVRHRRGRILCAVVLKLRCKIPVDRSAKFSFFEQFSVKKNFFEFFFDICIQLLAPCKDYRSDFNFEIRYSRPLRGLIQYILYYPLNVNCIF